MTTVLNTPLRSFDPSDLKQWKAKHPEATIRIEVAESVAGPTMSEEQFWNILALLDWGRKRNEDIIAPAVQALSMLSEAEICWFDRILAQKLFALDGEKYATPLGWNDASGHHFSVDSFLYARCCVVANGNRFYEKVLKNPSLMPQDCTFESLLYLAEKAYHLKTGSDDYDYLPPVSYEMFSNHEGWPDMPTLQELVKGLEA